MRNFSHVALIVEDLNEESQKAFDRAVKYVDLEWKFHNRATLTTEIEESKIFPSDIRDNSYSGVPFVRALKHDLPHFYKPMMRMLAQRQHLHTNLRNVIGPAPSRHAQVIDVASNLDDRWYISGTECFLMPLQAAEEVYVDKWILKMGRYLRPDTIHYLTKRGMDDIREILGLSDQS